MFIRRCAKSDPHTKEKYFTYQLVESYRTERGPRQRILLNLGSRIGIDESQIKNLANRIEEIYTGHESPLFSYLDDVEQEAQKFAKLLIRKESNSSLSESSEYNIEPNYHLVDLKSLSNEDCRTIGLENILYQTCRQLKLPDKLAALGLTKNQINVAISNIIARAVYPASELATFNWLKNNTALDEILDSDFNKMTLYQLYQTNDILLRNKEQLEKHLEATSKIAFNLKESIVFYDLTNTHFEGLCKSNKKAKRGKSKQKRSDCPLVSLGLVIDDNGFAKRSDFFEGNVVETKTFQEMIRRLDKQDSFFRPIIVIDAGIAVEANLEWLRKNKYPYIVVARKKSQVMPTDVPHVVIKDKEDNVITVAQKENKETNEILLYCHSESRERREQDIKSSVENKFERALESLSSGLQKTRTIKHYDKILLRIGRLKEKYKKVGFYYKITVEQDLKSNEATKISWEKDLKISDTKFQGTYCLRAHLASGMSEAQIWETYMMLNRVEEAFRCMKSELGMRPVCHHLEERVDGHLFITLLAYHLTNAIRYKLAQKGMNIRWETIRNIMATQVRVTTTIKKQDGSIVRLRNTTKAKESQKNIYDALEFSPDPIRTSMSISTCSA